MIGEGKTKERDKKMDKKRLAELTKRMEADGTFAELKGLGSFELKWKPQDPTCVQGLIFDANTEMQNYWLQIYDHGRFFSSGIYGITSEGRFGQMGMEYSDTLEEAKAHAELEWNDFRKNSRLYKKGE